MADMSDPGPAPDPRSGVMRLWSSCFAAAVDFGGGECEICVSPRPPAGAEAVAADNIGVWMRTADGWFLRMIVPRAVGSELPGALDAFLHAHGSAASLLPPGTGEARVATDRVEGGYRVRIG